MDKILAIAVIADLVLAVLKTFGLVTPITWPSIYWGFIALSFLAYGADK